MSTRGVSGACERGIQRYIAGSLDSREESLVAEHIEGCRYCRTKISAALASAERDPWLVRLRNLVGANRDALPFLDRIIPSSSELEFRIDDP